MLERMWRKGNPQKKKKKEKGTLLHCWWEPKWIQSLRKTVWRFRKNWEQNYHLTDPITGHVP